MADTAAPVDHWFDLLPLDALRGLVRQPRYRRLWALTTIAYVVISMLISQMLEVFVQSTPAGNPPIYYYWSLSQVNNLYLLPGVLIIEPHLILTLSLWPTLAMVMIGLGIGLAVAASAALLIEQRRARIGTASTAVAPVVTGWALLGACCCTSCAAQVGAVGILGATAGASTATLLQQAWPLAVVQLGILGLTLLYMEHRVRVPLRGAIQMPVPLPRAAPAFLLRLGLLLAGITWFFAFVLELSETPAADITWPLIYHWAFEHIALSGFAIFCGMAPESVVGLGRRMLGWRWPIRTTLLVAGVTWGIWVPPALANIGLGGFLNELFGFLGYPASWGAIPPDSPLGAPLYFHWAFQHLLLSAWAIAVAARPAAALGLVTPGLVPLPAPEARPAPSAAVNA